MATKTVLFLGASRGCGFYAALSVLSSPQPPTCIFLLRRPETFLDSAEVKGLPEQRRKAIKIVKGDATVKADVQKAVDEAQGKLDSVVFSIGGTPVFKPPFTFVLDNPNITRAALSVLLSVLQPPYPNASEVQIVVVSSNGLSNATHQALPWPLRIFYGYVLHGPHTDKAAMESILAHASTDLPPPPAHKYVFDNGAFLGGLAPSWARGVLVVQPALLTNGAERGIGNFRVSELLRSAWTISRRDTGLYIAEQVRKGQRDGDKGRVVLAY